MKLPFSQAYFSNFFTLNTFYVKACSLFNVDISRELTRPIAFLVKKGRKKRVFQNVFFSSISKELQVSIKTLYGRGVTSE